MVLFISSRVVLLIVLIVLIVMALLIVWIMIILWMIILLRFLFIECLLDGWLVVPILCDIL